jgi:protein-S-isoprenylcysteine O-methyltransferase Ste14
MREGFPHFADPDTKQWTCSAEGDWTGGYFCALLWLGAATGPSAFSVEGEGTLAPWDPPRKLVVRGTYRYVRNPMISGVLGILLGEAIFFGSMPIFKWFVFFAVLSAIYMPLSEEPGRSPRDSATTTSNTSVTSRAGSRA